LISIPPRVRDGVAPPAGAIPAAGVEEIPEPILAPVLGGK